ncbi:GNAT family N-acetyltransferase [Herbiconiux ginsengi]|uniref:Aminoglycoside 6'-N-acetyltransferase n=1 Tax=Herbiconiux ginsengi TaxID=381665 RepID=A0A1H3MK00_9MICO|nr:GNAT family protein [Herbiconiux ginsengi]SDY76459.1 aminoglycoside 6'-N-acetyltransferase [Herbiconiux ginsengi]
MESGDGEGLVLAGERVVLAPVRADDVAELRRIRLTPEVAARWGADDTAPPWPWDDPDAMVFTVWHEGAIVGMIQYSEETEPTYRHASIDIFLDPAVHRRGLGRDAVRTLATHLIRDRGHHRITIDPAADNEAAIRAYVAVGFRPVGIMRQYERDPDGRAWHDALLMDLLAHELR